MSSNDCDNVEIAITALAVDPSARIVLRAGEHDLITETRSLLSIGRICDVSALTTDAVTSTMTAGARSTAPPPQGPDVVDARCTCARA